MKKFEYKIEYWMYFDEDTLLAIEGEKGWELAAVVRKEAEEREYYFKREIQTK